MVTGRATLRRAPHQRHTRRRTRNAASDGASFLPLGFDVSLSALVGAACRTQPVFGRLFAAEFPLGPLLRADADGHGLPPVSILYESSAEGCEPTISIDVTVERRLDGQDCA